MNALCKFNPDLNPFPPISYNDFQSKGGTLSEQHNTKKCKYCGKELPEEAIFCYYCHRELLTRPERPGAETNANPINNIIWVIVALIVVSLVLFFIFK